MLCYVIKPSPDVLFHWYQHKTDYIDQASIPDHSVAQTPVSAFLATWDNLLGEMMRSSSWWWCCICSTTVKETLNSCTREIYGAKLKFRCCCQIAYLSGPAWACLGLPCPRCLDKHVCLAACREGWGGGGLRWRRYWRWRRTIYSL